MSDNPRHVMTRQALEQAVREAFPVLFHRLNNRYRDPQLAEEVSWDCLTQAFELWHRDPGYFSQHDLATWSSRRAGWRAVDRLRERSRHAPLPEEHPCDEDHCFSGIACTDPDAERRAADRARTWEAIQQLDERDRHLLLASVYEGRSDQSLGAELFGETGTAQARGLRIWRLRQKVLARLEHLLVEAGIDPEDWGALAV